MRSSELVTLGQASKLLGVPEIILKRAIAASTLHMFDAGVGIPVVDAEEVRAWKAEIVKKPLEGEALAAALDNQINAQLGGPSRKHVGSARKRRRMKKFKADHLWELVSGRWPAGREWLSIGEIATLVPWTHNEPVRNTDGTELIGNRSTYDFSLLSILSTHRRDYVTHEDPEVEELLNDEVIKTHRNNGLWRSYPNARVRRRDER